MESNLWKKALLSVDASIMNAVQIINDSMMKTALVTDKDLRLVGIVTDGDIRRALLDGRSLQDNVKTVLNRDPVVALWTSSKQERLQLMNKGQLISLPILDDQYRVVGLDLLATLVAETKRLENPVFLMAGGFGTRLAPLTDTCPKPLLMVGGKPILETIIERFAKQGFRNIYVSVHYLKQKISEYFGDGSNWGVSIKYIDEAQPLGTGGALGLLPHDELELPLIMMNGDLLTKVNFDSLLNFHSASNSCATVAVREYDFQVPYGVLNHKQGQVIEIVEKPIHQFFVNAGIYVLEPNVYKSVEPGTVLDMPTLLNRFIAKERKISMFPIHEYWLDVGRKNDFERAQRDHSIVDN